MVSNWGAAGSGSLSWHLGVYHHLVFNEDSFGTRISRAAPVSVDIRPETNVRPNERTNKQQQSPIIPDGDMKAWLGGWGWGAHIEISKQ